MKELHIEEIQCKSLLNRSKLSFTEYTLNSYEGCGFGCSYCYVPVLRMRHRQDDPIPWGGWVKVKVNAADVLRREMLDVDMNARILVGTATDSWQPIEKRYRISRAMLQELAYYPNPVRIMTRSPLLIRDIAILQRMHDVQISVSIPTFDEATRRIIEPHAPAIPSREALVKSLVRARVPVTINWCPLLPGVIDTEWAVRRYCEHAGKLGVRRMMCGSLHYQEFLGVIPPALRERYLAQNTFTPRLTWNGLREAVAYWSKRYGIECQITY